MTRIKICGIKRSEDIGVINEVKPEYIGFVFTQSPRQISHSKAKDLREMLDTDIQSVGVFANEDPSKIASLVDNGTIDLIQLHGAEDDNYILLLKELCDAPIIKALTPLEPSPIHADYLLLDSKGGGTGKTFDWSLIGHQDKPFFLAGGLSKDNVCEAIRKVKPFAVDASSHLETMGLKDSDKIAEFIHLARSAK